jgi:hypothetical protein
VAGLSYRVVDGNTSHVLATGVVEGKSQPISAPGATATNARTADLIVEAVNNADDKLADTVKDMILGTPGKHVAIQARVWDVAGSLVTLSAGADNGVHIGDRFEVLRIVAATLNPATKEILDERIEKVGEVSITSIEDHEASGDYIGEAVIFGQWARRIGR